MIYIDIYTTDKMIHLASFDIEFDWQYEELIEFEDKLSEEGIRYFEITTYQQEY